MAGVPRLRARTILLAAFSVVSRDRASPEGANLRQLLKQGLPLRQEFLHVVCHDCPHYLLAYELTDYSAKKYILQTRSYFCHTPFVSGTTNYPCHVALCTLEEILLAKACIYRRLGRPA